jgi:small subunit ribosomal protein S17
MGRTVIGTVTSTKMQKSIRVEIPRLVKHPKYGKYQRRKTVCIAHDEHEAARDGDRVELVECRPRSKRKCWELVRVIESTGAVAEVATEPIETA